MLYIASQSKTRLSILNASKIDYEAKDIRIDEDAICAALIQEGAPFRDIADVLAESKVRKLALKQQGLVLGCDQIGSSQGHVLRKPKSKEDLSNSLKSRRGGTEQLWTANVLYKDGEPIWRYIGRTDLTLHNLSDDEIDQYVERHWETVQHCAGGYAIENTPYLFSDVKGNWFDILGLSLKQLIDILKRHGLGQMAQVPKCAGVIGYPISHSKSPKLHGHWLDRYGIPGFYYALEVPPGYFPQTIQLLKKLGFQGANVTLPHKEEALKIADIISPAAREIGAANTLVFKDQIEADNTDAYGFMENIKADIPGFSVENKICLVIGAGGASRAIIWALMQQNPKQVVITNRTLTKAQVLVDEFGATALDWEARSSIIGSVDFVVNTSSLGMSGQPPLDIDLSQLKSDAIVTDIVYNPLQTDLLKIASENGCETVDGLGMLLHQAAPGFQAWFGQKPEVDEDLRQDVLS